MHKSHRTTKYASQPYWLTKTSELCPRTQNDDLSVRRPHTQEQWPDEMGDEPSELGDDPDNHRPRGATRAAPGNQRGPAYHATSRRARHARESKGAVLSGGEEYSDEEAPHEAPRGERRHGQSRDPPKKKKRLPDFKSQSQRAGAAAERRARKEGEPSSMGMTPVLD